MQGAHPCAMVIFGAGGDLTKRLLVPALYNLSRTKVLPEKFALIGVDLAEGTAESWREHLYDMLKSFVGNADRGVRHRPDRRGRVEAARGENVVRPGRPDQARAVREDPRRIGRARKRPTAHRATSSSISPSPTGSSAPWSSSSARRSSPIRARTRREASVLAPRGDREAVRPQPGFGARAERPHPAHAARGPDLPDRPLSGQGHGPEHHGVPLRQRAVRADLEPRPDRSRADHRGGDGGRGAARQVLRGDRRAARHGARTTCSRCFRWWRWSRRRASMPRRSAPRRPKCSPRCPPSSRRRRCAASTAPARCWASR